MRGTLRVYLGAAPGVGKTYDMLNEGNRRAERGTDVVIAFVECHNRPFTIAQMGDLDKIPRHRVSYRGAEFSEMDIDAVLARKPELALVDELAHTNVPGSRNTKRWQDVEELLDAGIDVVSTLNIQHLESLNDVVQSITGVVQRETIPDEVVRRAEQVELVDMAPEALRRRMAHGNIYAPEKVDAALGNYFRVGNLTALRELALLWVADKVDEALVKYRSDHEITEVWETRERVVVALTGGPEGETLIRRAARIAARSQASDVAAVHVLRSDGVLGASPARLERQRELAESLGGTFHVVTGDDVPAALLDFATAANATQLVLGTSRRPRWQRLFDEGIGAAMIAASGSIDVHMVSHAEAANARRMRLPKLTGGLTARRRWLGAILAVCGLPLLTAVMFGIDESLSLSTELLIYLAAVVGVALVGGFYPAVLAALAASVLANWFFTPPVNTLTIASGENLVALIVFVVVAVAVSTLVDLAARRARRAARDRAEASMLASLSGNALRGDRALTGLLEQVRDAFLLESVTLLERGETVGRVGTPSPDTANTEINVAEDLCLVAGGRVLAAADQRVLTAFAAQAAVAFRQARLEAQAAGAAELAESNEMRTALLAGVSHDLRTPLASIKASVTGLLASDVELDASDTAELLATIDESADRLAALVENLLDMSRLQMGVVTPLRRPTALDEVVPRALASVESGDVKVDIPESLPMVLADPGLLERAVANLVDNAARYSQDIVTVRASVHAGIVELRIVDRGPGVSEEDRERIFAPFQRLGDRGPNGVGLGLAVARGFIESMDGRLIPEDTPGGGLTMTVALAAVTPPPAGRPPNP